MPAAPAGPRSDSAQPTVRPELGGRLAGLTLPRQVAVLAVWPFFEQLLNSLVGFVDTALAGRLGVAQTNAVAVTGLMGWLMGLMLMALGVGSAALIARAIGGKHKGLAHAALGQSMMLAAVWGVVLGVGIFFAAEPIGRFFKLEGAELEYCVVYMRILACAAPLMAILFIGNACLRGAGDTRSPFQVMFTINIVNIIASLLFVYGPAPIGGWGVAGIAMGTALAWCVGGAIMIRFLTSGRKPVRLFMHRLRPHWHTIKRIVRVGIPNLIEASGMWVGNAFVARIIGGLDQEAALGAYIIAIRVESLAFLPAVAIGTAAATLAGQYLGLGDPARAKKAVGLCWALCTAIMVVMGLSFVLFPEPYARLLAPGERDLYELAAPLILLVGPVQLFFGSYLVLSQAIRGAGDTTTAMVMTYASTFLVRLPLAWVLGVHFELGLWGVWLALCSELVLRGSIFAARYLHGGWTRVRV